MEAEVEPKLAPNEMQVRRMTLLSGFSFISLVCAHALQINGRIYTLSEEFLRKHPGGNVIRFKLGGNATQVGPSALSLAVTLSPFCSSVSRPNFFAS